jgi:hypothetical protein
VKSAFKDVVLRGRTYRVHYYSNGEVSDVCICGIRTRERGQPKGAWNLDGERRLNKKGLTAQEVLSTITDSGGAQCAAIHQTKTKGE